MSLPNSIRRAMTLPMTRAALRALPGLKIDEDSSCFADALARLDKASGPKPTAIRRDMIKRHPGQAE